MRNFLFMREVLQGRMENIKTHLMNIYYIQKLALILTNVGVGRQCE